MKKFERRKKRRENLLLEQANEIFKSVPLPSCNGEDIEEATTAIVAVDLEQGS